MQRRRDGFRLLDATVGQTGPGKSGVERTLHVGRRLAVPNQDQPHGSILTMDLTGT